MYMMNIQPFFWKKIAQRALGFLVWSCKLLFKTSLIVYQKHRWTTMLHVKIMWLYSDR